MFYKRQKRERNEVVPYLEGMRLEIHNLQDSLTHQTETPLLGAYRT